MKGPAAPLSIAAVLACAGGPAFAHHSFAMFDTQKELKLEGTVRDFQWTNPHIWIQLLTKDASGKDVEWAVECSSPSTMGSVGWTRRTLKAGDRISLVIHPLKTSDEPGGALVSATINGRTLAGSAGVRAGSPEITP